MRSGVGNETEQAEPGAPDGAAPARAGSGGEAALVGDEARTRYTPRRRWRRARADTAAAPVMTGAGAAVPVEDRRLWTMWGPADGVMKLRCGRSSDSDARSTLRWTGTTCRAASLDCPHGARREMPGKRGWIGLKKENHGGPGRAGPRAKMYR